MFSPKLLPSISCPVYGYGDFRRAIHVLEDCIKPALPQFGFPRTFIAPGGYYGDMWWQLDFSIALVGLHWLDPALALDCFFNFETAQKPDGRIPLWGNDTLPDYHNGLPLQRKETSSFPRIFDAAQRIASGITDESVLERILIILSRYLKWWFHERMDQETGLISAVFEETFIPYYGFSREYAPVDLNVEIIHGCHITASLARRLHQDDLAISLLDQAEKLRMAVAARLWNPAESLFSAYSLKGSSFFPIRMSGSFAALRYQVASPEQRKSMIRILTDPTRFGWGKCALTSVDRTDPNFTTLPDGHPYNGNPSWSGSVWATINENVIRGLMDCGEFRLASELADHTLRIFKERFCEFLNPDTGGACGVMDYAWTAALSLDVFFSRLCGISFSMADRTLTIRPHFPVAWQGKTVSVKDLALSEKFRLSLTMECSDMPGICAEITGPDIHLSLTGNEEIVFSLPRGAFGTLSK